MNILDVVEIWFQSLRGLFDSWGVQSNFTRTSDERPKHSCSLNLRIGSLEVDFLVWESGEAELAVVNPDASAPEEHFDDLNDAEKITGLLSRLVRILHQEIERKNETQRNED
jgi:hypothetical protein